MTDYEREAMGLWKWVAFLDRTKFLDKYKALVYFKALIRNIVALDES